MQAKLTVFVVMLTLLLAGCGGKSTPTSLNGTWTSNDPSTPSMTAHISNNTIEIDFTNDDTPTLYWKGTLPSSASNNAEMTSTGDIAAMNASMLGSQDPAKQFVYKDGKLTFEFGILGTTSTIALKR